MTKTSRLLKIAALSLSIAAGTTQMTKAQVTTIDSGTCGVNLTWKLASDSLLTISGSGTMMSAPWRTSYLNAIKTLIMAIVLQLLDNLLLKVAII